MHLWRLFGLIFYKSRLKTTFINLFNLHLLCCLFSAISWVNLCNCVKVSICFFGSFFFCCSTVSIFYLFLFIISCFNISPSFLLSCFNISPVSYLSSPVSIFHIYIIVQMFNISPVLLFRCSIFPFLLLLSCFNISHCIFSTQLLSCFKFSTVLLFNISFSCFIVLLFQYFLFSCSIFSFLFVSAQVF